MEKCPICKTNDADKKNVHLIPWFLIKNYITEGGTGERDRELSFSISLDGFTKIYAGRSILPEKIEEFGELNDLQKEKENPYSRNNIICSECESKFSRIEAIFASRFSNKRLTSEYDSKNTITINGNSIFIDNNYASSLFELSIQSIFYRCSIGRFKGFKLPSDVEKKIEENIRLAFSSLGFKTIRSTEQISVPNKFPIISSAFFAPEGEDNSNNFIVLHHSRIPYYLLTGKWVFQLYEAEKCIKSSKEWIYGLRDKLKPLDLYPYIKERSHVVMLAPQTSKMISQNIINLFVHKKVIGIKKNIRAFYFYLYKDKPSRTSFEYICSRYFFHHGKGKTEVDSMMHAFNDFKPSILPLN
ncbi:hypothetical protein [Segetibacter koreensis]|uniref:hypothetical protein n=1 Tax=Segetibacter koreensis TaxID=398037 RepID=UPI000373E9C3|nr:hypothetical protein [Segetibacter koreensis]